MKSKKLFIRKSSSFCGHLPTQKRHVSSETDGGHELFMEETSDYDLQNTPSPSSKAN